MYYLEDLVKVEIIIYTKDHSFSEMHFSVASVLQSEKGKLK